MTDSTMRRRALHLLAAAGLLVGGCAHGRAGEAREAARTGLPLLVGSFEAQGLAVAARTPGAEDELWLADEKAVLQLDSEGGTSRAWKPPGFARILRIDGGDIDGDGQDELLVLADAGRVRAWILGWGADGWAPIAPPWAGWLRIAPGPLGAPVLIGSRVAPGSPRAALERVELRDGKLVVAEPLGLPPGLSVFDVAWIPQGDRVRLITLESNDRIAERDPRSPRSLLWRTDGRPVARPVEVERTDRDLLGEQVRSTIRLAAPTHTLDIDGDGQLELLVIGGNATPVAVLENLRVYEGGDVRVYSLAERGLVESVRTPILGVQMLAAAPWRYGGRDVLVAAVWTRKGGGFVRPETRVFLFDSRTGDLLDPATLGSEASPGSASEQAAPAVEQAAPAPPVEQAAPAPPVDEVASPPGVEEVASPPAAEEVEPAPVDSEPAPADSEP